MTQSAEGYVEVPTVTSGTAIRNLQITLQEPGGTPSAVNMQITVTSDKDGYVRLAEDQTITLLRAILRELRAQNTMIAAAYGQLYTQPSADDVG